MSKIAILVAVPAELRDFDGADVIYTGVGKVNAAMACQKAIDSGYATIINAGTAGSRKFAYGTVLYCTKFVQRDWDTTAFGDPKYANPSDKLSPLPVLEYGLAVEGLASAVCGTGDSFSTAIPDDYDLADMEAFAEAKVCKASGTKFYCLKYVSDGANGESAKVWNTVLAEANAALTLALKNLLEIEKRIG